MKVDANDALVLAGLILLAGGLWLVSPAVAMVGLGALLSIFGLLRAAAQARSR